MIFIHRLIEKKILDIINRDKSILLLGPRQTGKTTLLNHQIKADINYSFIKPEVRRRFESTPELLLQEIKGFHKQHPRKRRLLILIDEIQKAPVLMDPVQQAIDDQLAQFILTGSSARKLKRNDTNKDINLLPGRVIELRLDGLSLLEIADHLPALNNLLLNGCLPEILLQQNQQHQEELLTSYVNIYLEEEIRAEALVRQLASFARFLTYAAIDAGHELNVNKLSQEIGVGRHTIQEYYQILQDCLIADRIEPITQLTSRRRLTKSPKYLFFDMGLRRIAAGEGLRLPQKYFGSLFEQFIGIELLKLIRLFAPQAKLRYWRDHAGPEVDYVIEFNRQYCPIEVKLTDKPSTGDAKHLRKFMQEYECHDTGYVICTTPSALALYDNVLAIPWQEFSLCIRDYLRQ